jgi:cell division protein FtsN
VARDYKPAQQKSGPSGKGSSLVTGLLIGFILGIGVSVAVALFVKKGESPFVPRDTSGGAALDNGQKSTATPSQPDKPADNTADAKPAKPRFDFYTILPGNESPVTEQEIKQSKANAQNGGQPQEGTAETNNENYYLQVGAFQTEQEADNMKAKLALLGLEAVVQTANVPDKGVWHRVRVGPFTELDQITKARSELTQNGFSADLIKIHNNVPDQ